jgi:drug/metabolite transporter (DMT)-like permease
MSQVEKSQNLSLGISISLLAYIFFVTASSIVCNLKGKLPTIQIIFILNLVSLISIFPLSIRKGIERLKTKHLNYHLMRDVFGVLSYFLYYIAISYLNLSDATTLNYTAPFFVPIVWWLLTKESVEKNVWWSITIGFLGVAIILNPSKQIFQEGFLYGLLAGIASSFAFVALRMLNLKKEPMSITLFYYFLIGTISTLPFAIIYWQTPTFSQLIQTILIGIATVTAQMLLTIAYRYGTASYLSPLGYSTVIYAAISSWVLFDSPPTTKSFLGMLLIILGGTMTYIMKKKPKSISETFDIPQPKEKPPL